MINGIVHLGDASARRSMRLEAPPELGATVIHGAVGRVASADLGALTDSISFATSSSSSSSSTDDDESSNNVMSMRQTPADVRSLAMKKSDILELQRAATVVTEQCGGNIEKVGAILSSSKSFRNQRVQQAVTSFQRLGSQLDVDPVELFFALSPSSPVRSAPLIVDKANESSKKYHL